MIIKTIEDSILLSAKKNNKNQLVLILQKEDLTEILEQDFKVLYIGITDNLEIHIASENGLIVYQLVQEEVKLLINRYGLDNVILCFAENNNLNDLTVIFEGLLKLPYKHKE